MRRNCAAGAMIWPPKLTLWLESLSQYHLLIVYVNLGFLLLATKSILSKPPVLGLEPENILPFSTLQKEKHCRARQAVV